MPRVDFDAILNDTEPETMPTLPKFKPKPNPELIRFLNVSFNRKKEAKEQGAQYDGLQKSWYAVEGEDNYEQLVAEYGIKARKNLFGRRMFKLKSKESAEALGAIWNVKDNTLHTLERFDKETGRYVTNSVIERQINLLA